LTAEQKLIVSDLLRDAEILNTPSLPSMPEIDNLNLALEKMDRSHLKTHLLQILSNGLSVAETHSVLPSVSSRAIDRAKHLTSYNEILNSRYPPNTHRHKKREEEELAFIRNVYFNNTSVVPPAVNGATATLHRNDPSSIVSKRLQRITDKEMYEIYVAEWDAAHMGKPCSKTYLVAHRYHP
jgi:hypothetical protein